MSQKHVEPVLDVARAQTSAAGLQHRARGAYIVGQLAWLLFGREEDALVWQRVSARLYKAALLARLFEEIPFGENARWGRWLITRRPDSWDVTPAIYTVRLEDVFAGTVEPPADSRPRIPLGALVLHILECDTRDEAVETR